MVDINMIGQIQIDEEERLLQFDILIFFMHKKSHAVAWLLK